MLGFISNLTILKHGPNIQFTYSFICSNSSSAQLLVLQGHGAGQRVSQPVGVSFFLLCINRHQNIAFIRTPFNRICCFSLSYDRVDEIIWVKTNQLQRIIRTGRTGHWLNHGKEHCLVRRTLFTSHVLSFYFYTLFSRGSSRPRPVARSRILGCLRLILCVVR